jgi:hypothetical protein
MRMRHSSWGRAARTVSAITCLCGRGRDNRLKGTLGVVNGATGA